MRILAVDPGTNRCGLAVSDWLGMLAHPVGVIAVGNGKTIAQDIVTRAVDLSAEKILIGHPLHVDGTPGARAKSIEKLVARIRAVTDIPIELVDERFSSAEAEDLLREAGMGPSEIKKNRDSAAAAVILQWYLDKLASR